jgi:hypothetical protein
MRAVRLALIVAGPIIALIQAGYQETQLKGLCKVFVVMAISS